MTARTATKGRPTKSASRDLKPLILNVATDVFSTHGYAGASLRMISGALGVSVSSVAYHIKSKANLYNLVLSQIAASMSDLAARLEDGPTEPGQLVPELQAWTRSHIDYAHIILRDLMENADRAPGIEHWYLRDPVNRLVDLMGTPKGSGGDPAMRFVTVLAAVTYSEIAMPTIMALVDNDGADDVRARMRSILGDV